jgi:hypothetical protein
MHAYGSAQRESEPKIQISAKKNSRLSFGIGLLGPNGAGYNEGDKDWRNTIHVLESLSRLFPIQA